MQRLLGNSALGANPLSQGVTGGALEQVCFEK